MGSSDKESMEERIYPGERANSSGAAARHVVGELSHGEQQQLFLKKLYRLSQTHIEETPEKNLALARDKVRATVVVTPPLSLPTETTAPPPAVQAVEEQKEPQRDRYTPAVTTPPPSQPEPKEQTRLLESFASQLSALSSCITMDSLCAPRNTIPSPKSSSTSSRSKKKSPLLRHQQKPDIPETIVLEPSLVSRLGDEDSLARHMSAIARKQNRHQPPSIVEVDDASKNSPQCVAELSYEMEISRIIPPVKKHHHEGKKKRRFSKSFGKPKSPTASLTEVEMEF